MLGNRLIFINAVKELNSIVLGPHLKDYLICDETKEALEKLNDNLLLDYLGFNDEFLVKINNLSKQSSDPLIFSLLVLNFVLEISKYDIDLINSDKAKFGFNDSLMQSCPEKKENIFSECLVNSIESIKTKMFENLSTCEFSRLDGFLKKKENAELFLNLVRGLDYEDI